MVLPRDKKKIEKKNNKTVKFGGFNTVVINIFILGLINFGSMGMALLFDYTF